MEPVKYDTNNKLVRVIPVGDWETGIWQFCCVNSSIKLFENQYPLKDGMTYDSYFIEDYQPTVVDTVDPSMVDLWLDALEKQLSGRTPTYLVVQHLEPDHSGGLERFLKRYPECRILCSAKAAAMLPNFLSEGTEANFRIMKDGETISLGEKTLRFIAAPMVHWPEVMMCYDETSSTLFSADAFGTFGTKVIDRLSNVDNQDIDYWQDEAARYYYNICGKYGISVKSVLKKIASIPVKYICPLHGPVIVSGVHDAMSLYEKWSNYIPDFNQIIIAVGTLHGFTLEAANYLHDRLIELGMNVLTIDLAKFDISEAVTLAFRCPLVVFASATYDGGLVPAMNDFLNHLASKAWQGHKYAVIENGSWAPVAGRLICKFADTNFKDTRLVEPMVTIITRMNADTQHALEILADNISNELSDD